MLDFFKEWLVNSLGMSLQDIVYLIIIFWGLFVPLIKWLYKKTILPIKNKKGGEM